MKKNMFIILIISLLFVSCQGNILDETASVTIIDALNREIRLNSYPKRIVIAGRQTPMLANFAYLFSSASDKLIAVENRSQSVDQFLELIDKDFENKLVLEKFAGVEQIAPLEPDLVILKTSMQEEVGDLLEEIGIKVVYVSFESIEEIYRDFRILGSVFNEQEQAEIVIEYYQSVVDEIQARIIGTEKELKVILIKANKSDNGITFSVPSQNWLQSSMIQDLNASPVWIEASPGGGWNEVNVEQIFNWAPELLMVINYKGAAPEIVQELMDNQLWQTFFDDSDSIIVPFAYDFISWDQPDPRWILGYVWMAHRIYPGQVNADFAQGVVQDFYKELYGISDLTIENQIFAKIENYFE